MSAEPQAAQPDRMDDGDRPLSSLTARLQAWRPAPVDLSPARWPLLLAGGALLGAAALAWGLVPAWQAQADAARHASRVQRAERVAACRRPTDTDWTTLLPTPAQRDERLAELVARAQAAGLTVAGIEQRSAATAVAGLDRLVLELSAQGRYDAVRSFIAQSLQADPALALEHLRLVRSRADGDLLDARLRLVLLQRLAAGVAP